MTTTIIVQAHHDDTKEVHIEVVEDEMVIEETILNDGEIKELYVYDGREVSVKERIKE